MNNLATKKYLELQQEINTQTIDLLKAVSNHRIKQENNSSDWGYVGDIQAVSEHLKALTHWINQNK